MESVMQIKKIFKICNISVKINDLAGALNEKNHSFWKLQISHKCAVFNGYYHLLLFISIQDNKNN